MLQEPGHCPRTTSVCHCHCHSLFGCLESQGLCAWPLPEMIPLVATEALGLVYKSLTQLMNFSIDIDIRRQSCEFEQNRSGWGESS